MQENKILQDFTKGKKTIKKQFGILNKTSTEVELNNKSNKSYKSLSRSKSKKLMHNKNNSVIVLDQVCINQYKSSNNKDHIVSPTGVLATKKHYVSFILYNKYQIF